jgi:hypothetical protein
LSGQKKLIDKAPPLNLFQKGGTFSKLLTVESKEFVLSRWQVDVYVLVNCALETSDDEEVSYEPLNNVDCELGFHPDNCTLEYFDPRDSWDSEDAIGIGCMVKLSYVYENESESTIKSKVLEDFGKTQFAFDGPSNEIDYHIDFIAAWAFFDLDNPNRDEPSIDSDAADQVNGAFPNFIYGFMLDETSAEDFVGSDVNWYFTDDFTPAY